MLKEISGPKADEVWGVRKFCNEKFDICIRSPNQIQVEKMERTCSLHREQKKFG
jgi:hypothetical protein